MPRKTPGRDEDDDDFGEGEVGKSTNGGSCFYVNKSGLPVDHNTWERMWEHVMTVHPDGVRLLNSIRNDRHLPEIPIPHAPLFFPQEMSTIDRIDAVQKYLSQLQYNHTGTQFFDIKKGRPLCGLMDCAKDMIREALPIKCLEAVILAIYLTNSLTSVDRFPISFRSLFKGNVYRHVVLGLHFNGRYGAIGLSRREDLMYKPLQYMQLSEMVTNFQNSYQKYWHALDKVKIGLAVSHDPHTYECIQWRAISLNIQKLNHSDICHEVDRFSREIRKQTTRWQTTTSAYVTKSEKARSLSPKKPLYRPHPPTAPPTKPHRVQENLFRDRSMTSSMRPCCMADAESVSDFGLDQHPSHASAFSTTEIYDIRI